MAKNRYKQVRYGDKHACGHFAEYMIGGYSEEYRADEAARKFAEDCPDCQKAAATEEAKVVAKKSGLIDLEGTEKQVNWAIVIRQQMIERIEETMDQNFRASNKPEVKRIIEERKDRFLRSLSNLLANEISAKIYIDHRIIMTSPNENVFFKFFDWLVENYDPIKERLTTELLEEDVKQGACVYPDNYNGIDVELDLIDESLQLISPKDDEIIRIAKRFKFSWDWDGDYWVKWLNAITGDPHDRVAEVGSHLLNQGFGVIAVGVDKDKIINADYEPETDRWILRGDEEHVRIRWDGYQDELHHAARSLKTAQWREGAIWVHVGCWEEIEDFADIHGFMMTDNAKELIRKQREKERAVIRTEPSAPKEVERTDKLKEILQSSTDVLSDLIDDD